MSSTQCRPVHRETRREARRETRREAGREVRRESRGRGIRGAEMEQVG